MTDPNPAATNDEDRPAQQSSGPSESGSSTVETSLGRTIIDDVVVAKIAGLATREVSGVYALGGNTARMIGSLRGSFGATDKISQGVNVEVGESQAAVDLSIVAEYGVAIHELADAIRRNIIRAIERMTGLEVTEVNINVTDVHLFQDDASDENSAGNGEISAPRVQ